MTRITTGLLITLLAVASPREASALIMGEAGNKPVSDPGWPKGAAALFNHPGRIARWEGPPFGGGQSHAECRGTANDLTAVLDAFAKLDVKTKRLVIHDGTGYSFWLNPNNEPDKRAEARIDWAFTVWQPERWERLRTLPTDLNPTDPRETDPPAQIDAYTGGLPWADVTVPPGIVVDDQRLAAHGFTAADGVVIVGTVTDLATKQPLAATLRLQRVEPQEKGGYLYPEVAAARADAQGHWVLKHVPQGWFRLVVEADGFVPRVAGHARFDEQPRWQSFETGLARSAPVSGRITDEEGQPLAAVAVRLDNVKPTSGGRYEVPGKHTATTDGEGRFRVDQVPVGTATVWLQKPGYCLPGLGLPIATPKEDVALTMLKAASVRATVDFTGKERPQGYMVELKPEGGDAIGTYGGSGTIDGKNQMVFENVPPGRYVLRGHPNPSSGDQRTEPVTVDLKGGQTAEVTLKAR